MMIYNVILNLDLYRGLTGSMETMETILKISLLCPTLQQLLFRCGPLLTHLDLTGIE